MIKGDMRDKSQNNNKDGVFNNAHSGKPLRYTHDSLTKDLIGKSVTISLIGGRIEAGILREVGMYDLCLEMSNKRNLIILKSAILTVTVI